MTAIIVIKLSIASETLCALLNISHHTQSPAALLLLLAAVHFCLCIKLNSGLACLACLFHFNSPLDCCKKWGKKLKWSFNANSSAKRGERSAQP
jgi:hypothetical protein